MLRFHLSKFKGIVPVILIAGSLLVSCNNDSKKETKGVDSTTISKPDSTTLNDNTNMNDTMKLRTDSTGKLKDTTKGEQTPPPKRDQ